MADETAIGSAGTPDRRGHSRGGAGEQSPLQARAQFLKNRSWELVISLNRGACSRGSAQHGFNRETQEACAREWEQKQPEILSLAQTIEFLRQRHRRAPFSFLQRQYLRRYRTPNHGGCLCRFGRWPAPGSSFHKD